MEAKLVWLVTGFARKKGGVRQEQSVRYGKRDPQALLARQIIV